MVKVRTSNRYPIFQTFKSIPMNLTMEFFKKTAGNKNLSRKF